MEREEAQEKFKKLLKYYRGGLRDSGADNKKAEKITIEIILEELDRAREEGYQEGWVYGGLHMFDKIQRAISNIDSGLLKDLDKFNNRKK
jgi:hypothetical protein